MIGSASAPASYGNLGPGFDVIALALELLGFACPVQEWIDEVWVVIFLVCRIQAALALD